MGAKWKPGQREKFIATMRAKRENGHGAATARGGGVHAVRVAIGILRRAEDDYLARWRDGKLRRPDDAHLAITTALRALGDRR